MSEKDRVRRADRIQVWMPPAVKAALVRAAKSDGRPLSQYVCRLIASDPRVLREVRESGS